MPKPPAGWVVSILLQLAVGAGAVAAAQDPPTPGPDADTSAVATETGEGIETRRERSLDLGSPRAAVLTFLVAVQDAAGDHPERIDDAVQCLDTSALTGEDRAERARSLARRLAVVIDKNKINRDDIPAETPAGRYVVYRGKPSSEGESPPAIILERDPDTQRWRFSAATLASIPALEAAIAETAEAVAPVEDAVPTARRTPRATMTTFLDAMNADPPDLDAAIQCLNPAGQSPDAWDVRGADLAHKLKNTMDKIKVVLLTDIPEGATGPPFVWYDSEVGNVVIGRIEEDGDLAGNWAYKRGEWRFTAQTVKVIDDLYKAFEDKPIIQALVDAGVKEKLPLALRLQRAMPASLRESVVFLELWQWLALVLLVLIGWPIKVVVAALAGAAVGAALRTRRIEIDREVRRQALRSSGAVGTVLFWLYAVGHLSLPAPLLGVLLPVLKFCFAITAVWVGYRLVDVLGGHVAANRDIRLTHLDELLIPLLRKLLRLLVLVIVVLFVLHWFGKPPTAVLGALGIGGIAVAWAAQDTLGNFFGSITVLFDRPFGIGDWIAIGDIDGTVEHVGFRSTRVRTFYNSVVTIPNSKMVNTHVDNYGVRRYRRARTMLSVTYGTPPDKIDAFCEGIRELIRLHPYTRKDYYHVYFNEFSASSLDILLYVFFEAPDWATELREKHRLYVDILRLADSLGVEFAFPTQTVWLERQRRDAEGVTSASGRDDPERIGQERAAKVFSEAYGEEPVVRGPVVVAREPLSQEGRPARGHNG